MAVPGFEPGQSGSRAYILKTLNLLSSHKAALWRVFHLCALLGEACKGLLGLKSHPRRVTVQGWPPQVPRTSVLPSKAVLDWGWVCSQGCIVQCLETLWLVTNRGCCWHLVGRGWAAHRTNPTTKPYPAPKANSAEVEKPDPNTWLATMATCSRQPAE